MTNHEYFRTFGWPESASDIGELTGSHGCSTPECAEPSLQKPSFRLLASEGERPFVGLAGLLSSSQSTTEFGAGRMGQVVLRQFAAMQNGFDEMKPCEGTVTHGHRNSSIQLHHCRRVHAQQHIIETDDLSPIRVG